MSDEAQTLPDEVLPPSQESQDLITAKEIIKDILQCFMIKQIDETHYNLGINSTDEVVTALLRGDSFLNK